LACAPEPPIIKNETIKRLAFDFCNLDPSEINNDVLQTKRRKGKPIARERIVPIAQAEPEENNGEQERNDRTEDMLHQLETNQPSDGED